MTRGAQRVGQDPVALRSPEGAGLVVALAHEASPTSSVSSASSASSSSSSSSTTTAAPSPRVSLAGALSCRHCGKGESWGLHDLPAETLAYSRFSDSSNRGYLFFRGFLAVYWSFITVLAGTVTARNVEVPEGFAYNNEYGPTFFLYVTYWTLCLQCVYLLLAFAAALFPRHRALYRAAWALRTITAPAACLVSLLYWALIFPATGVTDYVDASIHGSNAVIMLADVAVSRLPLYAKHFYLPFGYTFLYALFNALYVAAGGRDSHGAHHIYEVLTYKPLGRSLVLLGGVLFVALPCIYALLWLETRVCLFLSGALTTVQPDHELLTPEPAAAAAAEGLDAAAAATPVGRGSGGDSPKASPAALSPTSLKLAEVELGGVGVGVGMHHRPHHHSHTTAMQQHQLGAVQAS